MERERDPSETWDDTSNVRVFNLVNLVMIIGYKLTTYIGSATRVQAVVDWLRDGLPPDLEPRMQATFDVVEPIAKVESEFIAQGFLIDQRDETGSYGSPARMLREADVEHARSVLIKLAATEFLSNEVSDPEDVHRRLQNWIDHAELPENVGYTCQLWQGRLSLALIHGSFPEEVLRKWDEGVDWPCWSHIIAAVPEMARARPQIDLTGFPFRYLRSSIRDQLVK